MEKMKMVLIKVILATLLTITVIECATDHDEEVTKADSDLPARSAEGSSTATIDYLALFPEIVEESSEGSSIEFEVNSTASDEACSEPEIQTDDNATSDRINIENEIISTMNLILTIYRMENTLRGIEDVLDEIDERNDFLYLDRMIQKLKLFSRNVTSGLELLQFVIADKIKYSEIIKKLIDNCSTAVDRITQNVSKEIETRNIIKKFDELKKQFVSTANELSKTVTYPNIKLMINKFSIVCIENLNKIIKFKKNTDNFNEADLDFSIEKAFKDIKKELTSIKSENNKSIEFDRIKFNNVVEHLKTGFEQLQNMTTDKIEYTEMTLKVIEEFRLAVGKITETISKETEIANIDEMFSDLVNQFIYTSNELSKAVTIPELKEKISQFTMQHLENLQKILTFKKNTSNISETDLDPSVEQAFKDIEKELSSPKFENNKFIEFPSVKFKDVAENLKAGFEKLPNMIADKIESSVMARNVIVECSLAVGKITEILSKGTETPNINEKLNVLLNLFVNTSNKLSKAVTIPETKEKISKFTTEQLDKLKNILKFQKNSDIITEPELDSSIERAIKDLSKKLDSTPTSGNQNKCIEFANDVANHLNTGFEQLQNMIENKMESTQMGSKVIAECSAARDKITEILSKGTETTNINEKLKGLIEQFINTSKILSKTATNPENKEKISQFTIKHLKKLKVELFKLQKFSGKPCNTAINAMNDLKILFGKLAKSVSTEVKRFGQKNTESHGD